MAAKTYPRFPLRVLRPRDQVLGGTSNYYEVSEAASIEAGFPLQASGGQVVRNDGAGAGIIAVALQDAVDKNGVALADGELIETFLANDPSQTWFEGNLMNGGAPAADYALLQTDMFAAVTLTFDPNWLGAGLPGYYFDVANPGGGIGADEGNGRIVSFINTRVLSNEEASVSVPGDTNAVVRVQLQPTEYTLNSAPIAGP